MDDRVCESIRLECPDIPSRQNVSTVRTEEWVAVYADIYRENNGYPQQVKPPA
jgi:hypothetical protein